MQLLKIDKPKTADEWRDYHVLAMAQLKQGNLERAEAMLRDGLEHAPTERQRTVCQNALGMLLLRKSRYAEAEQCLSISSAQIIQFPLKAVLKAHALAAQSQGAAASDLLASVKHAGCGKVIQLVQFLERRYGLGCAAEDSAALKQSIEDQEFALVLRAA